MPVVFSDPRLKPTPDYGSLGPGSDIKSGQPIRPQGRPGLAVFAVLAGALLAVAVLKIGGLQEAFHQTQDFLATHLQPRQRAGRSYDARNPALQHQAEAALEAAVAHTPGSNERIADDVDSWRGHLTLTPDLNARLIAALDSGDLQVRESAIEVYLAAYGLTKTPATVEHLIGQANTRDHATRIWALWTLGLLGNRGVETDRVVDVLTQHLKDSDVDSRHWAVEGLALVGTDATIPPLLKTFHDDSSPLVRERAACSLAQSGMLRPEQRRTAIPQLLAYTDDPALDFAAHTWAFHALRDITGQPLPDNAQAWRDWYARQ